jgi:predicted GNAT family acetyltransferase
VTFHPLDFPAWSALTGRHSRFAIGGSGALRYHPSFGVFAGISDRSEASMVRLAELVAHHGDVALLEADAPLLVPGLKIVSQDPGVQMVATQMKARRAIDAKTVPLGEKDAGAILELALLTEPGPFFSQTHRLGDFFGIKIDGRLIAMAGERMKPDGFTEVSGVCTHPKFRGRGYAGALIRTVAARILERGETPFLHAYAANKAAIALYEALGFVLRREVLMTRLGTSAGQ